MTSHTSGCVRPFCVTAALVFANIDGLVGFEVGDLQTGLVLDRVQVNGYTPAQLATYECPSHGLAFTPDERALWVATGGRRAKPSRSCAATHLVLGVIFPPKKWATILPCSRVNASSAPS